MCRNNSSKKKNNNDFVNTHETSVVPGNGGFGVGPRKYLFLYRNGF